MKMKEHVPGLAAWVCALLALGLALGFLRNVKWEDGANSDGKGIPVTKPFPRDHDRPDARTGRIKNPREEFEAARKRGLTEEEVRWIVEDFVAAGLVGLEIDTSSEEELLKMQERVMDWYLGILGEGFGWAEQQEIEAREKLFETAEGNRVRYLGFVEVSINWIVSLNPPSQQDLSDAATEVAVDFLGKTIVPGELCSLGEAQKGITGFQDKKGQWVEMTDGSLTLDYGTDERYVVESTSSYSGVLIAAGKFFPLSMEQVDRIRSSNQTVVSSGITITGTGSSLKIAKFLTAPQLRTLLLFHPETGGQLLNELGE